MCSTRRLLDRSVSGALVVAALAVVGSAAVSCSGDPDARESFDPADAAPEASPDAVAPKNDATPPVRDSGKSDASALAVACTPGSPCATSLVTTLDAEGFCALLQDGTVACWGANGNGELGRGPDAGTSDSPTPARVAGLADVVTLEHTCAIDKSGATWCWGKGPYLRDPAIATTTELAPVKLPIPAATKIAVTGETACAVVDGGVLCWGANVHGQLAVPEAGADDTVALAPRTIALPPGAPIHGLFVGSASFVLRADGTVVSWGANPPLARVSSLSPDPYPELTTFIGVSAMDTANDNACAVAEGIAFCWGSPIYTGFDQYPLVPLPTRKLPEAIATPEPVVDIATTPTILPDPFIGSPQLPQRACACGVSGTVYCWGINASGQAGDGTLVYASAPVSVVGLPAPAARVRTTPKATCALLTTGKIYCWGDDFAGQLGIGKREAPNVVPQEVRLP